MPAAKTLIYLAGPVSNCNSQQKTHWRQEIKFKLDRSKFDFIDPTEHEGRWDPKIEMSEINRCDLVIANLWRESIGTVVGIVQARRRGKPVIVIDPNFLNSIVLKKFVGDQFCVTSIEKALNVLKLEVLPLINHGLQVRKKKSTKEDFSFAKLQRSLNAVCEEAGISDAYLPVLVAQKTLKELRAHFKKKEMSTADIRKAVFDVLHSIALDDEQANSEEMKRSARDLIDQWEMQEVIKGDRREVIELKKLSETQAEWLAQQDKEIESLKIALSHIQIVKRIDAAADSELGAITTLEEVLMRIQREYPHLVVVHERALRSAGVAKVKDPLKFYELLVVLTKYTECLHAGMDGELQSWLSHFGFPYEYASGESETTRNDPQCRKDRTITLNGTQVVLNKHIKIGKLRLHFEILDDKLIIGHLGHHLKLAARA